MDSDEKKQKIYMAVFLLLLGIGFLYAREISKREAIEQASECIRESYEMARQYGGHPKEHERDCLQQKTEDQYMKWYGD